MALDHFVKQVHLKELLPPETGGKFMHGFNELSGLEHMGKGEPLREYVYPELMVMWHRRAFG